MSKVPVCITVSRKKRKLYIENLPDTAENKRIIMSCPDARRFVARENHWAFELTWDNLVGLVNIEKISPTIEKVFMSLFPTFPDLEHEGTGGFPVKVKPFPHQGKIVNALRKFPGNFGLFLEIGTGKTAIIVHLLYLLYYQVPRNEKILIVCPNNVLDVWIHEAQKHSWIDDFVILRGTKTKRERIIKYKPRIICNYHTLRQDRELLAAKKFGAMILDEGHAIKNSSQQSAAAHYVGENIPRKYLITGTPLDKTLDLFLQLAWINPHVFGGPDNATAFKYRYFKNIGKETYWKKNRQGKPEQKVKPVWEFKEHRAAEFEAKLKKVCLSLKLSSCVNLPERIFEKRYVEMTPEAIRKYWEVGGQVIEKMQGGEGKGLGSMALTNPLRKICSGFATAPDDNKEIVWQDDFKLKELDIILDEVYPKKCLIWVNYQHEGRMIDEHLSAPHVYLKDEMSPTRRKEEIKRFRSEENVRYFITSPGLSGEGETFNEATVVIFYGHGFFELIKRIQAEGRNYRIGQKLPVIVIDMVCKNMIDEFIVDTVTEKGVNSETIKKAVSIDSIIETLRKK